MMQNNNSKLTTKAGICIDLVFFLLLLITPFISYTFIFNSINVGSKLYMITITFIWLFIHGIFFYKRSLNFSKPDLFLVILIIYSSVNFLLLSNYTTNYSNVWCSLCFILIIFILKRSFNNSNNSVSIFKYHLIIIVLLCFIQSIIGLLQFFNLLNVNNEYFNITGTFLNPNFLGVYMTLGVLAYTGLLLSFKENKKKFYTIFAVVPIIIVLILSESRAAWISLGAGYSVFLITSKRSIKIFTSLSKVK